MKKKCGFVHFITYDGRFRPAFAISYKLKNTVLMLNAFAALDFRLRWALRLFWCR